MKKLILLVVAASSAITIAAAIPNTSVYSRHFQGHRTASGAIYDRHKRTVAHRSLPFGTCLDLENPLNGRHAFAVVNDRGPFFTRRALDLSEATAADLGFNRLGTINYTVVPAVECEAIDKESYHFIPVPARKRRKNNRTTEA